MRKLVAGLAVLAMGTAGLWASSTAHETYALMSSTGQPAGTVSFTQKNDGPVKVKVKLVDLPVGLHAVHIHANASCTAPDFKDAGGHFNPTGKEHGFENLMGHHAGDTPANVAVGEDHKGEASFELKDITLAPGHPNSVPGATGLSFVVHAGPDDMKTNPSGNSGNRIACVVMPAQPAVPAQP